MKYVAAVLILLVVGFGAYFFRTYTVVETKRGGEYLVLRAEQAKECDEGNGCAVWSAREFQNALMAWLIMNRQRGGGPSL